MSKILLTNRGYFSIFSNGGLSYGNCNHLSAIELIRPLAARGQTRPSAGRKKKC